MKSKDSGEKHGAKTPWSNLIKRLPADCPHWFRRLGMDTLKSFLPEFTRFTGRFADYFAIIAAGSISRSTWVGNCRTSIERCPNGVQLVWLTFDEGYGGKPEFLKELTARQQKWVAEVPKSACGWLTRPRVTERPYRTSRRGRQVRDDSDVRWNSRGFFIVALSEPPTPVADWMKLVSDLKRFQS